MDWRSVLRKRVIGYFWLVLLLVLPVFLASCSNVKTYRSDIQRNFRIEPKVDLGSEFRLDIFDVDSKCEINYVGSVQLDNGSVEVGLPVNRPVYMELILFKPASLFHSASATVYPMLFMHPRSGQKYVANVSYLDHFYKVQLREGERVIEIKSLETCQKSKSS